MVKATAELNELVREFVRRLEAAGLPIERVLLWGKYARGKASDESDVQLMVVSRAFEGMDVPSRIEALAMPAADLDIMIQAWGYTPEELRDARGGPLYSPFLSMAVGESREIYPTPFKTSHRIKARNV